MGFRVSSVREKSIEPRVSLSPTSVSTTVESVDSLEKVFTPPRPSSSLGPGLPHSEVSLLDLRLLHYPLPTCDRHCLDRVHWYTGPYSEPIWHPVGSLLPGTRSGREEWNVADGNSYSYLSVSFDSGASGCIFPWRSRTTNDAVSRVVVGTKECLPFDSREGSDGKGKLE